MREPFVEFVETKLGSEILLITCGLPATWKTETSAEVARIKSYPILRSDLLRLEVLKGEDVFDAKVAGNMSKRLSVYDEMFRRADDFAGKSKGLILDATFITQELRRRAAEIAVRHNMTFVILETKCPQEVSVARLQRRTKEKYESNALTVEAYLANKRKFEPVDLDDLKTLFPQLKVAHLIVDTCKDSPEDWYIIGMKKR
ncbi:MAG: ATP-binding protein [Candidatus Bathyarchaeota archaeon]|nr:ATP-binding protein [Candidatus Bathyarchaeota archaeon]